MDTKALRQKILDLAIRGKLVPQDPNDEPASALLERIRAEKQQMVKDGKLKKKDIKNDTIIYVAEDNLHYEKFNDGNVKCIEDEIPFELPEGWAWARLKNISAMSNGTAKRSGSDGTQTAVLRLANLGENEISFSDIRNVILTDSEIQKYALSAGDVIFIRVNGSKENVGKSFYFEGRSFPVAYCDHLIRCTSSVALCGKLLSMFVRCGYVRQLIEDRMVSAAGQNTISQPSLGTILLPIPPLTEQERIIRKIEDADRYIAQISDSRKRLSELVDNAKSKILDLAIRGQLVPQDSNDEPASVLLERIRSEKEALIKAGKLKRDKKESVIFKGGDSSYYLRSELGTEEITDELPFEIPDSWEWAKIGDVMQINPRNKLDDSMEVSFVPMPLIDDGFSGRHTSDVRIWKSVKSGFTHFMEGDIGIAKITPCFENRKSIVFKNLTNGYGAGTTELHILRPYASTILAEYVLAYVKSSMFIGNGVQEFTGAVGQQRIGKDYVEGSFFPIPPLAEQSRIVEQIAVAFKQLDIISNSLL